MEFNHIPVLLNEAVKALNIFPDGVYVDCTAGGGGHSSEILSRLSGGRLISIDRDPDAIEVLNERLGGNKNVTIVNDNFQNIKSILQNAGEERVNGILADLGVSSHQLDCAERGFSYHKDAPLDMRMSKEGTSAADLVNTLSKEDLQKILFEYGEEKFAKKIAANIVAERQKEPILTTFRLAEIIKNSVPAAARRDGHPARKSFQALRISTNQEESILRNSIKDMFDSLASGGRLAIITFHSLEDRIVKKSFAEFCKGCTCPPEFPVCICGKKPAGKIPYKAVAPSEEEINENYRSRSAKLRVIEKI